MNFPRRLRQLRKELNITQEEIAQKLNITKANISKYETGRIEPNIETLTFLSNFFDVSIDYLLGRTNNRKIILETKDNLHNENNKYKSYDKLLMDEFTEKTKDHLLDLKIIDRIRKKLLESNILNEDDPITQDIIDLIIKYGEDAAIEILKLKKKQDK